MFWDKISPLYDLFENVYNHKVYAGTGKIENGMPEKVGSEPDRIQSAYHDSKNI